MRERAKVTLPRRIAPVIGLMLLSPIAAEYLIGYDESIGHPLQLLVGLLFLAPLYGAVAVLIREIARRSGRGWPTILLLGAAFGLIQAGLIDQSLFNPDYRGIPFWDEQRLPTLIPALGFSAYQLLGFVGGHVIWSFAAPVAVVESFVPRMSDRPWLGRFGLMTMVVLYFLGAGVNFADHINNEQFVASSAQLGGTAVAVVALAVAAFVIPRSPTSSPGWVPPWWLIGCVAFVVLVTHHNVPPTWTGVAVSIVALTLLGAMLLFYSGREGWGREHVLAAGGAALLVNAALSFLVEPLGDPSYVAKYAANTGITLGVLVLLAVAMREVHKTKGNS